MVYDGVGAPTVDGTLDSLRPRGLAVLYGAAGGAPPPIEVNRLALGSLFVTRPALVHYLGTPAAFAAAADDLFTWIADGSLRIIVGGRFPLEQAGAAHEALESRGTTGKLLLDVHDTAP